MPVLLILDTCGSSGYLAVVESTAAAHVLADRVIPGRETQERLMVAMAEVLVSAHCLPAQLAGIAVVTGPGSFTGVRIGLAAAKGLAEACALPVFALSRLAVLAEAVRPRLPAGSPVTVWLDAGRTDLYTGEYVLQTDSPPHSRAETLLPRQAAFAAAGPVLVVEDASLADLRPGTLHLSVPEVQQATCTLAVLTFQACRPADIALLDANYLRVPDAELALRARQTASA